MRPLKGNVFANHFAYFHEAYDTFCRDIYGSLERHYFNFEFAVLFPTYITM